jgi:hypothetical protein
MNDAAIGISLTSLILSAVAYWRSGGKQDIERARIEFDRKVETLRVKQEEFVESIEKALATAYETSRQHLQAARETLEKLRNQAIEGVEKQIQLAQQQLEALARRLEEAAKSAKDATVATAQSIEQGIARRARRVEARAALLFAKGDAKLAVGAAALKDFARADELLEEADVILRNVREILGDDHAYDQLLDKMKLAVRDATAAVRSHAQDVRTKIEQVLTDADRLVGTLESDEEKAAKQPA